jgi:hypothetical protein
MMAMMGTATTSTVTSSTTSRRGIKQRCVLLACICAVFRVLCVRCSRGLLRAAGCFHHEQQEEVGCLLSVSQSASVCVCQRSLFLVVGSCL